MTTSERAVPWLAVSFGIVIFVAAVIPVAILCWTPMSPMRLSNLTEASQYYTIIASLAASFIPVIGLYMGYVHFSRRTHFDQKVLQQNRYRDSVTVVFDRVEKYNACLMDIFHAGYCDDNDLTKLRRKARQTFDNVKMLLETPHFESVFLKEDRIVILELDSIVDKNDRFSHGPSGILKKHDLNDFWDRYYDHYKKVVQVCASKLAQTS